MRNCLALAAVVAVIGILLGGCDATNATPIKEINTSPANFDGKEVTLRGVAKDPMRILLLNTKDYVLKDDSGEVTVMTEADQPNMNEKITIKVKVANIAIINGERWERR